MLALDLAAMRSCKTSADDESKTQPVRLACFEWLEQLLSRLNGNTGARIVDSDAGPPRFGTD